jgi:hypothetical protein
MSCADDFFEPDQHAVIHLARRTRIGAVMSDRYSRFGTADLAAIAALTRSSESLQIEQCWKAIRDEAVVPLRSDVTARSIPPRLLSSLGLCRVRISDDAVEALYRLAGSHYRQMTGVEITGNHYQQFVEGGSLEERTRLLRLAFDIPVGVWWVSEIIFDNEYACLYQSTLLPLRDVETGDVDHLLDLIECDVPLAMRGRRGIMSRKIFKHVWIDLGAGTPN